MDQVTAAFEAQRGRLRAVAYRVLGSHADAEDVVQEAWLRLARNDPSTIENLAGWLTTVVGRISLDVLRSRQARPEASYGLSELVVLADDPAPDEYVALADSVGLALLAVLDSLGPSERLALVLHDMFAVSFQEIGQILGKSADAAKMTASRARRKLRAIERPAGDGRGQREVVEAFRAAASGGDFAALLKVLDPDVRLTVHTADGPVVSLGATTVATGAHRFSGLVTRYRAVLVNGRPGYVSWREDGTPFSVTAFTVAGGRIAEIEIVVDPARISAVRLPAATRDGLSECP